MDIELNVSTTTASKNNNNIHNLFDNDESDTNNQSNLKSKGNKKIFIKKKVANTTKIIKNNNEIINNKNDSKNINFNTFHHHKQYPLFTKFSEPIKTIENEGQALIEEIFSKNELKFKDLSIHPHIVVNLERIGLTLLTEIQEKAIPEVLSGKNVFIRSQTGSGKTLAYAIPIVESLRSIEPHISRKDGIKTIIVVPTRELALQTYELLLKLVEPFRWIVPGRLCGGENRNSEKARLRKGITILVGTPGRLLDHALHTQNFKLDNVTCVVLDEADRLLDMGFQKDVNKLMELIDVAKNTSYDPIAMIKSRNQTNSSNVTSLNTNSKSRQTILLSATLTSNVKDLANFTMTDYVYVDPLNKNSKININDLPDQEDTGSKVAIPQSVIQKYVVTNVRTRLVVLSAYIIEKVMKGNCKMFIFMASRPMIEYHEILFKKCLFKRSKMENNKVMISLNEESDEESDEENALDIEFFKLHGSMDQKQRTEVFKAFRSAKTGILLCTDVAARGVDIPLADYVVQYTPPQQDEDYIHRVGRTGRVGKKGIGLLFLTETELSYINHLKDKDIFLKRIKQEKILASLLSFMEHARPGSIQSAAEFLQQRFEKAVLAHKDLHKAACLAFSTWYRYYCSFSISLRTYFDKRKAHLGHYATSFALRESPQQISRLIKKEIVKNPEVKLNKYLENHDEIDEVKTHKPLQLKKRPRSQELIVSEFDSGLPVKKKKIAKT